MTEILTLSEKSLKYAHENVNPQNYITAMEAYQAGYRQAQEDNPYHWRDPKKEKPQLILQWLPQNVLISVRCGSGCTTMDGEYDTDGKWRVFDYHDLTHKVVDSSDVLAWMPYPFYSDNC